MPPQSNKMYGKNAAKKAALPMSVGKKSRIIPGGARMSSDIVAPTSLTNLAQLSGITLVPVNSIPHSSSNTVPTTPQRNNTGLNRPTHPQLIRQSATSNNIRVTNTANGSGQKRTTQHAPKLPSVQLLNSGDLRVGNLGHREWDLAGQSTHPRSYAHVHANRGSHDSFRGPQHINLAGNVDQRSTHYHDISSAHSMNDLNQLVQQAGAVSLPPEEGDMTLVKLMAILNNPALTITPVDAAHIETTRSKGTWNKSGIPATSQSRVNSLELVRGANVPQSSNANNKRQQATIKAKARVPKSAANLQLLSDRLSMDQANEIDATSQVLNQKSVMGVDTDRPLQDSQAALDWLSSLAVSRMQTEGNSVTLSWLPGKSNLDNDLAEEQPHEIQPTAEPLDPEMTQTMSVQLLHQLASQTDANKYTQDAIETSLVEPATAAAAAFEPECLISTPRVNIGQLDKGARDKEIVYSVTVDPEVTRRRKRPPFLTTKERLWIPGEDALCKSSDYGSDSLADIEVEPIEEREVLISERHLMLERMVEIAETVGQRKQAPVEPDDIFVNRSKRIMSKIDTELEKRKRRRFERICDRSASDDQHRNQSDDSDEETDTDESSNLFESTVVPIQLPLDEATTAQKRDYLSSVGLVSREYKNKLSLRRHEDRLKIISALAFGELDESISGDAHRFVDMIHQTDGTDIQLRTETNIKRNELPFIEGLNRNTSRIKMSYMSALGLDKRSKRTTLYKVAKSQESAPIQQPKQHKQQQQLQPQPQLQTQPIQLQLIDLKSNTQHTKAPVTIGQICAMASKAKKTEPPMVQTNRNNQLQLAASTMIAKAVRLAQASCRSAMQAPNKDEYMKSLGLTAS